MKIAVGNSRMEKIWLNQEISWEEFCERVKNTIRTSETMERYKTLSKVERDNIKDVGGFVGGHLKEGKRRKGHVICRSILTLDMDYGRENIWEEICKKFDFKCLIYSTHKHRKESPRLRLIIPLEEEISEEEYEPLSRMVSKEIGMDLFDDSTYEASRLMYWPSTSSDGDFVYEQKEGALLDPKVYLKKYENWEDCSTWPVSSRELSVVQRSLSKQEDPLTKDNIIGAFCRSYTISEVIDKFLREIYTPSVQEGRYDYIPATSSCGVVVYDDKFAYSHHATDKASGKLLNAFDLLRIHKFGHLDEDKEENIPINKLPSFLAMNDFVINDEKSKVTLIEDRMNKACREFSEVNVKTSGDEKEDSKFEASENNNWKVYLELNKKGGIKETLENLVLIIENDENLKGLAFNCHCEGIYVKSPLPWEQTKEGWSEADMSSLKVYISKKYGIYSPLKTKDALLDVVHRRKYHPIKEYLENLQKWDNIPRVETLLVDYFGAEDSSYTKAVMRKTLVAAVSRINKPGVKFDSVLILNGPQGIGKSTFFEKLACGWFSDSLTITDMRDKSGAEKLQGYWILELGELAGMKKMEVEVVKSFLSREDDKYRPSYGLCVESHPRKCIIVGSTNAEGGFLRDITGNRRFWPVRVNEGGKKKPWQLTKEEVNQIWAEVMVIFKQGENLYLEGEDSKEALTEQSNAMETDEREGLVRAYLDKLLPTTWAKMDLYERRNFLRGGEFGASYERGTQKRKLVCNMEIWCECFNNEGSKMKSSDSYAISAIMKKIENWQKYSGNKASVSSVPIYGRQRCYEIVQV